MMKPTLLKLIIIISSANLFACSRAEFINEHKSFPEMTSDNVPTGKYYEIQCLKILNKYTIELDHVVFYGVVMDMKKHKKSDSHHMEALSPDDTIRLLALHTVTDSTNYRHATREALMYGYGYPMVDSMLHYSSSLRTYYYYQKDSPISVAIRHGDIHRFKHFRNNLDATSDFPPNLLAKHPVVRDWHGKHLCPLKIRQSCLFYIQNTDDSTQYEIVFGKIVTMKHTTPESELTLKIKNEITNDTNKENLSVEEIMTSGKGFPDRYAKVLKTVRHDEIKEFRPLKTLKSEMKPPKDEGILKEFGRAMFVTFFIVFLVGGIGSLFD